MRTADGYIISKCLDGNSTAFGFLVDKYKESVYALAYSMLHNFHDTEDVTQEVFIKAYKKLHTLKRYDSFHAWLFAITSNLCKNWIRNRSRRPDREFIEDQDQEVLEEPSMDHYREELVCQSVREALELLPETYYQTLTLYYLGGMKTREIAEFLGTSPTAIRHRLTRARAYLKEEMLAMMDTNFGERGLPGGFTFHILEAVKHIRIRPITRMTELPWGLSIAAGIILTVLSLNPHLGPLEFTAVPTDSQLLGEIEMMEVGEVPVDMLYTFRISPIPGYRGYSNGGGSNLSPQQNAVLMAPRGEDGEFPEEPLARLGKGTLGGVAYSPDGKILAAAGGLGIWLYDARDLDEIALLREERYSRIAFSPDGKTLAVSDLEYGIQLWDVNEQTQIGVLTSHKGFIYSIAFSPDGKMLASCSYDKKIFL